MILTPNTFHVMRSTEAGEQIAHAWLSKRLADEMAALLNEIERERVCRLIGRKHFAAAWREGVGDRYYVKEVKKEKRVKGCA